MKTGITFIVGAAFGVAGLLAFQNPHKVGGAAHQAVSQTEEKIAEVRHDKCVADFLERTNCYQVKGNTQEFCAAQIAKECSDHSSKTSL